VKLFGRNTQQYEAKHIRTDTRKQKQAGRMGCFSSKASEAVSSAPKVADLKKDGLKAATGLFKKITEGEKKDKEKEKEGVKGEDKEKGVKVEDKDGEKEEKKEKDPKKDGLKVASGLFKKYKDGQKKKKAKGGHGGGGHSGMLFPCAYLGMLGET